MIGVALSFRDVAVPFAEREGVGTGSCWNESNVNEHVDLSASRIQERGHDVGE